MIEKIGEPRSTEHVRADFENWRVNMLAEVYKPAAAATYRRSVCSGGCEFYATIAEATGAMVPPEREFEPEMRSVAWCRELAPSPHAVSRAVIENALPSEIMYTATY